MTCEIISLNLVVFFYHRISELGQLEETEGVPMISYVHIIS